ncbi:hypothetical protein N0V82_008158 [Gnomoniopsis sp. IMI 355080]|nr:hypothetical protein N0V82_008158 [Gnomoniopsis sp. IMI 355080]
MSANSSAPHPTNNVGASATPRPARPGAHFVTTSFLVSNMHCPTCISAINHELNGTFESQIRWVSPNIVTSVVTVEHDSDVPIKRLADVLTEAGYEVSGVSSSGIDNDDASSQINSAPHSIHHVSQGEARPTGFRGLSTWFSGSVKNNQEEAARIHLLNCERCRTLQDNPTPTAVQRAGTPEAQTQEDYSSSSSPTSHPDQDPTASKTPNIMSSASVTSLTASSFAESRLWQATIAIEGMTCASCVNNVKRALDKDSVTKSSVNLLSNSATVEFHAIDNNATMAEIVEAIEDSGYGASVVKVDLVEDKVDNLTRTVEIMLKGMYCQHCPGRVVKSLKGFRRHIDILTPPTPARPIIKFTYVPEAPDFTIREILAAIQASDQSLEASIYHPPSLEERSRIAQHKHQRALLFRAAGTLVVAIPTFIIGVVYMSLVPDPDGNKDYLMMPWVSGITRAQIAMFVLATPVYFFAADVFHRRAIKEIKNLWRIGSKVPIIQRFYRFGSMNTLMSLGTTIAYVSSVAQLIAAGIHHPERIDDKEFYFDSVVFLTLFLLFGRWIEAYSKAKTGDAVTALGKLRPTEAILVGRTEDGKEKDTEVQADLLDFGDIIRIRHGASPPADAVVVEGQTSFDESSLTGEARLITKNPDDAIYAGTINKDKPIKARITGAAGTSMLDQIVQVVREGQTKRAPIEQVADVLTTYFVPVVTLVAVLTWLIWMILGLSGSIPESYLDVTSGGWVAFALQFAIAVFVVACPCGLGLAAPTAIFVGGGLAAKHGILAKGGGEAFQKASAIDCVIFDKTGTLTEGGLPQITNHHLFPDGMKQDAQDLHVLVALKLVEESSSHPIAKALVSFCKDKIKGNDNNLEELVDLEELPGKGMHAQYKVLSETYSIFVGNESLLHDADCEVPDEAHKMMDQWKTEAKSVALVAIGKSGAQTPHKLAAIFAISDPIRPEAAAIVRTLQSRGTQVWMLSGDNATTARAVASLVNIPATNVISGVLPTGKADQVKRLQSTIKAGEGSRKGSDNYNRAIVAMVGDGINDSPALTQADVGIAIGSGSDVAISSAEFVLVNSDLWSIVTLLDLSKAVFRRVKVNFAWALVYNVLAVPIAAGVLMPIVSNGSHVRLDPVWASLAMALSSISVVMSSLALRTRIPGLGFRMEGSKS